MENLPAFGWEEWTGKAVVVDTSSPYVFLGMLRGHAGQHLILEQADVHDLRDTHTSREQYVLNARKHGIRVNRKRVLIALKEMVGISLLEDVIEE